jgi:hypothetical protein
VPVEMPRKKDCGANATAVTDCDFRGPGFATIIVRQDPTPAIRSDVVCPIHGFLILPPTPLRRFVLASWVGARTHASSFFPGNHVRASTHPTGSVGFSATQTTYTAPSHHLISQTPLHGVYLPPALADKGDHRPPPTNGPARGRAKLAQYFQILSTICQKRLSCSLHGDASIAILIPICRRGDAAADPLRARHGNQARPIGNFRCSYYHEKSGRRS